MLGAAPAAAPAVPAPPPPDSGTTESGTSGGAASQLATVRAAEAESPAGRKSGTPKSRPAQSRSPEVRTPEVPSPGVAKYLQLERKDCLLWPRQLNELTILRRVLNRRRGKGEGERITENTLVRVAIDLLMANAGQLQGSTEEELRQSLGLGE
jgi:hypothetical protein